MAHQYFGSISDIEGPDTATPAILCAHDGAVIEIMAEVGGLPMTDSWTIACFFRVSKDGTPDRSIETAPEVKLGSYISAHPRHPTATRVFLAVLRHRFVG